MNPTYELISAMEAGKSVDMQNIFNELMSEKITTAIDGFRDQIAGNLFKTESTDLDESVENIDEISSGLVRRAATKLNFRDGGRLDTDMEVNAAKKGSTAHKTAKAKLKHIDGRLDKYDDYLKKKRATSEAVEELSERDGREDDEGYARTKKEDDAWNQRNALKSPSGYKKKTPSALAAELAKGKSYYDAKKAVRESEMDEAVVPGSVKKDKEGHITSAKTVPDAKPKWDDPKPRKTKKEWDELDRRDDAATSLYRRINAYKKSNVKEDVQQSEELDETAAMTVTKRSAAPAKKTTKRKTTPAHPVYNARNGWGEDFHFAEVMKRRKEAAEAAAKANKA